MHFTQQLSFTRPSHPVLACLNSGTSEVERSVSPSCSLPSGVNSTTSPPSLHYPPKSSNRYSTSVYPGYMGTKSPNTVLHGHKSANPGAASPCPPVVSGIASTSATPVSRKNSSSVPNRHHSPSSHRAVHHSSRRQISLRSTRTSCAPSMSSCPPMRWCSFFVPSARILGVWRVYR